MECRTLVSWILSCQKEEFNWWFINRARNFLEFYTMCGGKLIIWVPLEFAEWHSLHHSREFRTFWTSLSSWTLWTFNSMKIKLRKLNWTFNVWCEHNASSPTLVHWYYEKLYWVYFTIEMVTYAKQNLTNYKIKK